MSTCGAFTSLLKNKSLPKTEKTKIREVTAAVGVWSGRLLALGYIFFKYNKQEIIGNN